MRHCQKLQSRRMVRTTLGKWGPPAIAIALTCGLTANCTGQVATGNTPPAQPRYYGGWQSAAIAADDHVRQAYFQAPGMPMQPSGLPNGSSIDASGQALPQPGFGGAAPPSLPPASLPQVPVSGDYSGATPLPSSPVLPPNLDQFANPGGALPPTDVRQASGSGLRNAQVQHQSGAQTSPMPGSTTMPGYHPAVMQQGQPYQMAPGVYAPDPNAAYGQPGYGQSNGVPSQPVLPPSQLRNASVAHTPGQVGGQPIVPGQTAANNIPVVSQDPRFVMPPVQPRVGNFATSPYRSPYRTVSYQLPQQAAVQAPMQQVQTPTGLATQPAVVPNTSTLPQYQPTVGVYPTGYQSGYPYCPPGIPAGGVPQVVPGAVAPPTYPPNLAPQLYSPDNAGFKPLFSLGQENYNVQLGRGIIGQPTAYVPGQPVRNFLRYLSP